MMSSHDIFSRKEVITNMEDYIALTFVTLSGSLSDKDLGSGGLSPTE